MSNPYGDYGQNPYDASESVPPAKSDNGNNGKVKAPAIALIVCGVIDALYGVVNMVTNLMGGGNQADIPSDAPPAMKQFLEQMNNTNPVVGGIVSIVMIAAGAVIVFGGMQMLKQRAYGLAMTAAILNMLPCVTCLGCCGVGEGIGIWALVILMQEDVKRSFQ